MLRETRQRFVLTFRACLAYAGGRGHRAARFPRRREWAVGSCFRRNDGAPGEIRRRGATRSVWRLRADWIPACAGTTGHGGRLRADWIPACAGMTGQRDGNGARGRDSRLRGNDGTRGRGSRLRGQGGAKGARSGDRARHAPSGACAPLDSRLRGNDGTRGGRRGSRMRGQGGATALPCPLTPPSRGARPTSAIGRALASPAASSGRAPGLRIRRTPSLRTST